MTLRIRLPLVRCLQPICPRNSLSLARVHPCPCIRLNRYYATPAPTVDSQPPVNTFPKNEKIQQKQVRLISADGTNLGVKSIREALGSFDRKLFDLVQVSLGNPVVCKVLPKPKSQPKSKTSKSFDKSGPTTATGSSASEKKQVSTKTTLKTIEFSAGIQQNDLENKLKRAVGYFAKGYHVQIYFIRKKKSPRTGNANKNDLVELRDTVLKRLAPVAKVADMTKGRNGSVTIPSEYFKIFATLTPIANVQQDQQE